MLYSDATQERLALLVQRQLRAVGVEATLEEVPIQDAARRVGSGQFDAWLIDMGLGPALFRVIPFWQSKGSFNWGGYTNASVDAAFTQIRRSKDDDEYKAGVAAFQRAIADDPPAIFLAWSERARAVSTRFEVPVQPGRDILRAGSLALWRPASIPLLASRN